MARKITMFELHFDGAHFGPTVGESSDEADADETTLESFEDDETAPGSRFRPALAAVGAIAVVSAVGVVAARRLRGASEPESYDFEDHGQEHDGEFEQDHDHVGESDEAMLD